MAPWWVVLATGIGGGALAAIVKAWADRRTAEATPASVLTGSALEIVDAVKDLWQECVTAKTELETRINELEQAIREMR